MNKVKNNKLVLLMVLPCFLLYTIIQIWPLAQSLYYSFFEWKGFGPLEFVGLDNYIKLFTDDTVMNIALKNTMLFALLSLVMLLPLSFMIAVALASKIKLQNTFSTVLYVPSIVATVVISLMWSAIFNANTGVVNTVLNAMGLEELTRIWLGDSEVAMYVIIFVNAWQWAGYHMLIFFTTLVTIPRDIYEAAEIDGSKPFSTLLNITIPLMKNPIKMNAMLIIIGSFKCFDIVYTMTSGGPSDSTQMLATYMYNNTFRRSAYGYGSAISVVIFVLCVLTNIILQRVKTQDD